MEIVTQLVKANILAVIFVGYEFQYPTVAIILWDMIHMKFQYI